MTKFTTCNCVQKEVASTWCLAVFSRIPSGSCRVRADALVMHLVHGRALVISSQRGVKFFFLINKGKGYVLGT